MLFLSSMRVLDDGNMETIAPKLKITIKSIDSYNHRKIIMLLTWNGIQSKFPVVQFRNQFHLLRIPAARFKCDGH